MLLDSWTPASPSLRHEGHIGQCPIQRPVRRADARRAGGLIIPAQRRKAPLPRGRTAPALSLRNGTVRGKLAYASSPPGVLPRTRGTLCAVWLPRSARLPENRQIAKCETLQNTTLQIFAICKASSKPAVANAGPRVLTNCKSTVCGATSPLGHVGGRICRGPSRRLPG